MKLLAQYFPDPRRSEIEINQLKNDAISNVVHTEGRATKAIRDSIFKILVQHVKSADQKQDTLENFAQKIIRFSGFLVREFFKKGKANPEATSESRCVLLN